MLDRKILHLDLDAFFCAVEELLHPELKGKAFAVGGRETDRGVIASCSYAARVYGVRSAMPTKQAKNLCPDLILVSSGYSHYQKSSSDVMAILGGLTPLVEQISIDEAFLDVSDLPTPGEELARSIQSIIFDRLGLPSSLGVASNKLMAKIANDVGKQSHRGTRPPMAITVVNPGKEAEFLAPLPIKFLWGVGPKTEIKLNKMGIFTIGEIASVPDTNLEDIFGKMGRDLSQHARGIDDRPVVIEHEIKSISQETTFDHDRSEEEFLIQTLRGLCEQVCYRLRKNDFCGSTIKLKLRWSDFQTISRQTKLSNPTDQDEVVFQNILKLFKTSWKPGQKVRLLGVGVSGLFRGEKQLSLWETPEMKEDRLLEALDELHQKFGKNIVRRANRLNKSNDP